MIRPADIVDTEKELHEMLWARGYEDDPLPRAEGVMKGLRDVVERKFGGNVVERPGGLEVMGKAIGVEFLVMPGIFVKDEERFLRAFDGAFPHEKNVGVW